MLWSSVSSLCSSSSSLTPAFAPAVVIVPTVRLPIVELVMLGSLLVDPALSTGEASLTAPLVCDLVLDLLPADLVLEGALELDIAEAASSFLGFCSVSWCPWW